MGSQGQVRLLEAQGAGLLVQASFVVEGNRETCSLAIGTLIWQFPQENAVLDVYNSVRIQSAFGDYCTVNPSVL